MGSVEKDNVWLELVAPIRTSVLGLEKALSVTYTEMAATYARSEMAETRVSPAVDERTVILYQVLASEKNREKVAL